ncbi:type I restriction enzyme M protein [Bacteroidales bacterium KHT7]|nr:type I restriction enzyme M protein [Bacteroidales bacterium KHT7]
MALNNFVKSIRNIMRKDAGINGDAQRIEQIAWMLFLKVYDEKENDWEFNEDDYTSFIPENCRWRNWAKDNGDGEALTAGELLKFVNDTLFPTLKSLEVTPTTPMRSAIVRTTFEDANQYMKDGVLLRQVINVIDQLNLGDYEESHAFGEIYESILKEMQSAGSAGEFYTPRALTDFMAEIINPKIGEKMADFACGTGGFITSWLKALDKKVQTAEDKEEYAKSIYGIEKKQFPYMLCVTNMLLHDIDSPRVMHDNSLTKDVLNYTDEDKFDVVLMNPPYGGSENNDIKQHFPSDLSSSETANLFMVLIMYRLAENGRAAVILPDGFLFNTDDTKLLAIKKKMLREFNLHTIIRLPGSIFAPYTPIATNILFFNNEKAEGAEEGFCTKETWFYRMDMPEGYKHFSKTKPMRAEHCQPIIDWWNDRKEIVDADNNDEKSRCFTAQQLLDMDCNLDQCKFPKDEEEILPPAELLADYYKKRAALDHEIDKTLKEIQRILGIEIKIGES